MSEPKTLLLGFIAGVTILFGLPLGRMKRPAPALRHFLNALAVGILTFLIWDVLTNAWGPVDAALTKVHDHSGGLAPVFGYGALFFGGLGVGLLSLAYYERRLVRRRMSASLGPGAMAASETATLAHHSVSTARQLALLIAVGIGLHNFGEGLAIGGSAARGEIALATLLVIGFALHNATEGFGIVAPLSAEGERPEWSFLLLLGLIGGGPTFIGTAVGRQFTSDAVSVLFLTLAAGSIIYVVLQLVGMAAKSGRKELLCWGVFLGMVAGFVTDAIVTMAGA